MNDDTDILNEMAGFQKTVATCLSILPLLFAGQCLAAIGISTTTEGMLRDFGSKLPVVTQIAFSWRPIWLALAIGIPGAAIAISRRKKPIVSVVFSTVAGLVLFGLAQFLTYAMWAPILQIGNALAK